MSSSKSQGEDLKLNERHRSDGSELIPAEVQADIRHEASQPVDDLLNTSYTVDDEGLLNNYAIEPDMYPSDYPSAQQQRKYIFLGVAAILLVVLLVLVSSAVS